jgi:2-methylcitrate dehydratase PrpD
MSSQKNGKERYIANQFAEYATRATFDDLSVEAVSKSKELILDTLGTALIGSTMPWSRAIYKATMDQGGRSQATVCADGDRISCTSAAFINGSYAHANDFDEFYSHGPLHPVTAAVWTAIPLAEHLELGGKDVICSVNLGTDICVRLAEACFSTSRQEKAFIERGFQAQAVCGVLSSAVQAGALLKLDEETLASAIGVAGSYPGGTVEFLTHGTDTKRHLFGKASQQGIFAAMLAQHGFRGPHSIVEGKRGFLNAYCGTYVPTELTKGLGTDFRLLKSFIKSVNTMGGNFGCLEALQAIIQQNGIEPNEVESVEAALRSQFKAYSASVDGVSDEKYRPSSRFSAEMSLPYLLAATIHNRGKSPTFEMFDKPWISNPAIIELAQKVIVETPPEMDAVSRWDGFVGGHVKLVARGETFEKKVLVPHGEPRNPLTWKEVTKKFLDNAEPVIGEGQAQAVIKAVESLESIRSISELTKLLCVPKKGSAK